MGGDVTVTSEPALAFRGRSAELVLTADGVSKSVSLNQFAPPFLCNMNFRTRTGYSAIMKFSDCQIDGSGVPVYSGDIQGVPGLEFTLFIDVFILSKFFQSNTIPRVRFENKNTGETHYELFSNTKDHGDYYYLALTSNTMKASGFLYIISIVLTEDLGYGQFKEVNTILKYDIATL